MTFFPSSSIVCSLVVDVFSQMLSRGTKSGMVRGLKVGVEGPKVSHLQFADDTILFLP